jgi:hypothetical protein
VPSSNNAAIREAAESFPSFASFASAEACSFARAARISAAVMRDEKKFLAMFLSSFPTVLGQNKDLIIFFRREKKEIFAFLNATNLFSPILKLYNKILTQNN